MSLSRYEGAGRVLEWVVIGLVVAVVVFVALWAYDFDPKCLFAECRRIK